MNVSAYQIDYREIAEISIALPLKKMLFTVF